MQDGAGIVRVGVEVRQEVVGYEPEDRLICYEIFTFQSSADRGDSSKTRNRVLVLDS